MDVRGRMNRPTVSPWTTRLHQYRWLVAPVLAWSAAGLIGVLFLHLGSEVNEGETRVFDTYFLRVAYAMRAAHPWLEGLMRDLSGLGSTVVLLLLTLGVCGYLALTRSRVASAIVLCSIGTGVVAVESLKAAFGRVRPDAAFAAFPATGMSFPSGHSSMSAVVFLTLGALWAHSHDRIWERVYILCVAALLTVLVGVSRAALGVHWATDVIGGWAFGIAWATAWLLIAKRLDGRPGT